MSKLQAFQRREEGHQFLVISSYLLLISLYLLPYRFSSYIAGVGVEDSSFSSGGASHIEYTSKTDSVALLSKRNVLLFPYAYFAKFNWYVISFPFRAIHIYSKMLYRYSIINQFCNRKLISVHHVLTTGRRRTLQTIK